MTATKARRPAAKTAHAGSSRTAYLVLGMHRSGTSAVTQLLALAGANLPVEVMPGDEHNAKGYFEPWRIAQFNDERLRAAGGAWDDVFGFPFRPLPAGEEQDWLDRAKALFADEYGAARHPLLKDPRVTILLPLWRSVLDAAGIAARCVIPVRHPLAVAGSLARRDGFPAQKSVLLWSSYMLAAEAYTRDLPRVFVDYDSLLRDWRTEAVRMQAAHGAPLPGLNEKAGKAIDKFLTADLRHNQGVDGLADLGWAGELAADVLAWFHAAAADRAPTAAPLMQAGKTLAARREEFGVLVSPIARDLDEARTELREARVKLQHFESEMHVFYRAIEQAEAQLDASAKS